MSNERPTNPRPKRKPQRPETVSLDQLRESAARRVSGGESILDSQIEAQEQAERITNAQLANQIDRERETSQGISGNALERLTDKLLAGTITPEEMETLNRISSGR